MTKIEKLEAIKNYVNDNEDYVKFLDAEIARIKNRAAKANEKRAEKTAEKGAAYTEAIRKALADAGRAITLAELVAGTGIEDATPGRVTYYTKGLVDAGEVVKDKAKVGDKKVTTYALAE